MEIRNLKVLDASEYPKITTSSKTDVVLDVVAIVSAVHVLITFIIVDLRSDFKSDINASTSLIVIGIAPFILKFSSRFALSYSGKLSIKDGTFLITSFLLSLTVL